MFEMHAFYLFLLGSIYPVMVFCIHVMDLIKVSYKQTQNLCYISIVLYYIIHPETSLHF